MDDPRPYSPNNPFAPKGKTYSPANPFAGRGTVTVGPVQVVGTTEAERVRALAEAARQGDIGAALELGTTQSNAPAMVQAQAAIDKDRAQVARIREDATEGLSGIGGAILRQSVPGLTEANPVVAAANVAGANVVSPLMPRLASAATDRALDRFTRSGGNAAENANLLGVAGATGDVLGNIGLGKVLPVAKAAPATKLGARLLQGIGTEAATGAVLGGTSSLLEGDDPGTALRNALLTGAQQAGIGTVLRGLPLAAEAVTSGLRSLGERGGYTELGRGPSPVIDLDVLTGREPSPSAPVGRIIREIPPNLAEGRPPLSPEEVRASMAAREARLTRENLVRHGTPDEVAEHDLRARIEGAPVPESPEQVALRRLREPLASGVTRLPVPTVEVQGPILAEAGIGAPRILTGLTGGIGGAAYGATQGDTPEERAKNALLYGLGGLALGVGAGAAAERLGERGAIAEPVAGKAMADALKVEDRVAPAFRVAPPSPEEAVASGATRPGPTSTTPYVNLDKFALEGQTRERLRAEAERVGTQLQGNPRRPVTFDEWRAAAQSLGFGDLAKKDFRSMNAADMLASRNIVATNIDRLTALDTEALKPTLTAERRFQINREMQALSAQNDQLLRKFIPARTATARDLGALRMVAQRNLEPIWWLAKAEQFKGSPLTDLESTQLRRLLAERDRQGIADFVSGLHRAPFGQKAATIWKANILTNPKTHLVNTAANITLGALEMAKDVPAVAADVALSKLTGRRTIALPSRLQAEAAMTGAKEGAADALAILKGGKSAEDLAKMDLHPEVHFDNPVAEAYTQGVFNLLGAADKVPKQMAFRRSLANQAEVLAQAEGLTGETYAARVRDLTAHPTTEMAMRGASEAAQAVVQDQTAIGNALKGVAKIPVVGDYIMPFQRTPGAVATRVGEYTLGAPIALGQIGREAAKGTLKGISAADQATIARLFGRGVIGGIGLIGLGALARQRGWITGVPADWQTDRNRSATDQMRGVQGNSLVLAMPGHRIQFDYSRLSPAGNLLAVGAMAADAAGDKDPETSPWGAVATGALGTVVNQPFLQGIQSLQDAAKEPGRFGAKLATNIGRGFIPASGLLGAITRNTDATVRQPQNAVQDIESQLPGLSKNVPAKQTPLGEEQARPTGLFNLFSPMGRQDQPTTDPVLNAIGDYHLALASIPRKEGESEEDYIARAHATGQRRREEIQATLDSQEWADDTTTEGRQQLLKDALHRAELRTARATRQAGRSYSRQNPFAP